MKLKKAIAEFWTKLFRKGFPVKTIKRYLWNVEKFYTSTNNTEERQAVKGKAIENYIYSQKKWSDGTRRVIAVQIRAFLRFCLSEGLSVAHPEQITIKKYHQKEARYLNEQEEAFVLDKSKDLRLSIRTSIVLMLTTGLRVSEAAALTKKQLKSAELVAGMYQIPFCGKWWETKPIFLPKATYELCKILSEKHKKRNVLGIQTTTIQNQIKKFSNEIKLKFSAHTLRHTYITRLAQKWVELYKVQKLARHTCIISTSRYLHSCNLELAQVAWLIAKVSY